MTAVVVLAAAVLLLGFGVLAWAADRDTPHPDPTPAPVRDVCDLQRCDQPARVVFNGGTLDGRLYICERHAGKVSQWAPVIGTLAPFDQDGAA